MYSVSTDWVSDKYIGRKFLLYSKYIFFKASVLLQGTIYQTKNFISFKVEKLKQIIYRLPSKIKYKTYAAYFTRKIEQKVL